jgi:hypothetical protein
MRILVLIFAIACGGRSSQPERPVSPDTKRVTCSGADVPVTTSAQCDDGACYQLPDGTWCTNLRPRW